MPSKRPIKSTDRRRQQKPPAITQPKKPRTLEQVNEVYKKAASQPFKPLFNDRRGV
jgi:hypothetical protein